MMVGACHFYTDPSHIKPLPSLGTQFWMWRVGWAEVKILNVNPLEMCFCTEDSSTYDMDTIKDYFCATADYALIGRK